MKAKLDPVSATPILSYDTRTLAGKGDRLNLRIDSTSTVPLYAQVVEQIKALVGARALRPGDRLPSVRDLAVDLRVNRNTAAKAYQMLEVEGVIETRQGDGSFISAGAPLLSSEERKRRLERILDRALLEASHLEIPFEEIPRMLQRQMRRFTAGIQRRTLRR